MERTDGKLSFDYIGIYNKIKKNNCIGYTISGGRNVQVIFVNSGSTTQIIEIFETVNHKNLEGARKWWQAILDNFKKYVEQPTVDR